MQYNIKTRQAELEAAVTHGIGLLLSVIGAYVLFNTMPSTTDPLLQTSCAIYISTLILVYTASTMSHIYSFHPII